MIENILFALLTNQSVVDVLIFAVRDVLQKSYCIKWENIVKQLLLGYPLKGFHIMKEIEGIIKYVRREEINQKITPAYYWVNVKTISIIKLPAEKQAYYY